MESLLLYVTAEAKAYSLKEARSQLKAIFSAYKNLLKDTPKFKTCEPAWSERDFIKEDVHGKLARQVFELRFESVNVLSKKDRKTLASIVQEFAVYSSFQIKPLFSYIKVFGHSKFCTYL